MEKTAARTKGQATACDSFDPKPGVPVKNLAVLTCGSCGHYDSIDDRRLFLCPFNGKSRPEDRQD